jgi:hypothetical protein
MTLARVNEVLAVRRALVAHTRHDIHTRRKAKRGMTLTL